MSWVEWKPPASVKRTGPHVMTGKFGKKSRVTYTYCAHCGLISLRNDATQRALKKPCVWEE